MSATASDSIVDSKPKPWLLVGLGNPGKKYEGTRHNVGFEMLDTIAEEEGISVSSIRFKALLGKGGHGGHNGMRSIINHFKGSRDFPRLRIGIGRPPGKMDPVNFVLRPFTRQEREELNLALQKGLEGVRILLLEGFNKSASFVNQAKASNLLNS